MRYEDGQLRRLQAVELGMLLEIGRVCAELNIEWFLDSGTALGAARHQGFIPWDDDIDVGMLRADYDRFLEEAPALLPHNHRLCTPENTDGYAPQFAKVMRTDTVFATQETIDAGFQQGVFIDIFPYDAVSADGALAQKQRRQCTLMQRLSYLYHSGSTVVPHKGMLGALEKMACSAAHHVVHALFTPQRIASLFDRWARCGAADPSGDVMVMSYAQTGALAQSVLLPCSSAQFAGHELPVPGKLDVYLSWLYGDWKTLPPEDERRNHAPLQLDV